MIMSTMDGMFHKVQKREQMRANDSKGHTLLLTQWTKCVRGEITFSGWPSRI